MTLVAREGHAHFEVEPDDDELRALQAAVTFAALNQNPGVGESEWQVLTSDNLDLFSYRLDTRDRHFATTRGSMVQVKSGGLRFDSPSSSIMAPLELYNASKTIGLEADVADAVYSVVRGPDDDLSGRLLAAIGWLGLVWRNSPSISWNVRAVFARSGIESLLGSHRAWDGAVALRERFELLRGILGTETPFDELLWNPSETPTFTIKVSGKDEPATPLQHWYWALSNYRNSAIHTGGEGTDPIHHSGDQYDGAFVWTGERVLRDLIRAELTIATGEPIVQGAIWRAIWQSTQSMG